METGNRACVEYALELWRFGVVDESELYDTVTPPNLIADYWARRAIVACEQSGQFPDAISLLSVPSGGVDLLWMEPECKDRRVLARLRVTNLGELSVYAGEHTAFTHEEIDGAVSLAINASRFKHDGQWLYKEYRRHKAVVSP